MRKSLAVLPAFLLIFSLLTGCGSTEESSTFTYGDLSITLPADFSDLSQKSYGSGYTFLFGSSEMTILGIKEEKSELFKDIPDMTLAQYGRLLIQLNGYDCDLTQRDGRYTFSYTADLPGQEGEYAYTAVLYETGDAFWVLQCYCPGETVSQNRERIWDLLCAVKIK